jgi:hypothetical protein
MKGLAALPALEQLAAAYNDLQSRKTALPLADLALWSQWARLDPRLAQMLVQHLARFWRQFAWGEMLMHLQTQPWPRALLVLLRFAQLAVAAGDRSHLKAIINIVDMSTPGISQQLFFIPLQRPPTVVIEEEVQFRTEPYVRSGYLGSQSLLSNTRWPSGTTALAKSARQQILTNLLAAGRPITVTEYRQACRNLVARRQAQRDLAQMAQGKGFTRNRYYQQGPLDYRLSGRVRTNKMDF